MLPNATILTVREDNHPDIFMALRGGGNNFGIVTAALVSVLLLTSGFTALPTLRDHINSVSSFKLGRTWMIMAGGVTPVILGYILIDQLTQTVAEGYNDMPQWFVNVFGWGMAVGLIVISYLISRLPWSRRTSEAFTSPAPSVQDAYLDRKALENQESLTHYPDTAGRTPALGQDFSLRAIYRGTVVRRRMPWTRSSTERFRELQKARGAVADLLAKLPPDLANCEEAEFLRELADPCVYNIVQLIYQSPVHELDSKDYNFSRAAMQDHWARGLADGQRTLERKQIFQRPRKAQGVQVFDFCSNR